MFTASLIHPPESFHVDETHIGQILEYISEEVEQKQFGMIHLAFLSDGEIQTLNHNHRWINSTTDVLSFHYFDDFDTLDPDEVAGEIIFSESRIISQSEEYSHTPEDEFSILLIHSLLHLLWYDHEDEEDFQNMWLHEEKIREKMNLNTKR